MLRTVTGDQTMTDRDAGDGLAETAPPALAADAGAATSAGSAAPARFGSSLSAVLFIDMQAPGAVRPSHVQRLLTQRVCSMIRSGDDDVRHAMCWILQERIVPALCAENLLQLCTTMQDCAPWMIEQVPKLSRQAATLRRAADLAVTFMPENLERLILAMRKEAGRQ